MIQIEQNEAETKMHFTGSIPQFAAEAEMIVDGLLEHIQDEMPMLRSAFCMRIMEKVTAIVIKNMEVSENE